eukprot:scaffold94276_cov21-Tisochrysis_lutea.AAC.3
MHLHPWDKQGFIVIRFIYVACVHHRVPPLLYVRLCILGTWHGIRVLASLASAKTESAHSYLSAACYASAAVPQLLVQALILWDNVEIGTIQRRRACALRLQALIAMCLCILPRLQALSAWSIYVSYQAYAFTNKVGRHEGDLHQGSSIQVPSKGPDDLPAGNHHPYTRHEAHTPNAIKETRWSVCGDSPPLS